MSRPRIVAVVTLAIMASLMVGPAAGQEHAHFERSFTVPDFCRTGETVLIHVRVVQNFMTDLLDPVCPA